jgi:hypothetical protein
MLIALMTTVVTLVLQAFAQAVDNGGRALVGYASVFISIILWYLF